MNQTRYAELKQAERGAILSIVAYIFCFHRQTCHRSFGKF